MTLTKNDPAGLTQDVVKAFDSLEGYHAGFRPTHAKGLLLSGIFIPAPAARSLTRAPHAANPSTPVSVRFSDFGGMPAIPDADPNASPRGMATRFHLAEHVHTDIVAHSVNGFLARTAEEFIEFLRAAAASGPGAPKPSPIEKFLATHPDALHFVQTPKPTPASFLRESFFSVSACKFTNAQGASCYGRYRIRPEGGSGYLDAAALAAKPPDFLFDELRTLFGNGGPPPTGMPKMHIFVQIAAAGDTVDDSTVTWPEDRPEIEFGTLELTGIVPDNEAEQRHIIFDPIPRVDGIEPSGDPLFEARAAVYLASGRRRRAGGPAST